MAAISRAQQLTQLVPGLNALFGLTYKQYKREWRDIYDEDTSERSFEEETKLSGFGAAPIKPEGSPIEYDTAQEAWTTIYRHETVAMGFTITEEAMEDNLYDKLAGRYTKQLANAMRHTKEIMGAATLNRAFITGSNNEYTYGDGQQLCSTSHPLVSGGTNANRPAVGVDLNETSLEAAAIEISQWTDERGLRIACMPKKLIIPTNLQFVATRVLESSMRVGTADNDLNALKSNGTIPGGYSVNHWLTDPDAWFLTTDVPNGLKYFKRVGMKTAMDGDFDTGNARYKARERYSFGVSDPLGIYGSPGA